MHVLKLRGCVPLLIALFVKAAAGQADWPTYGHDSGSKRYSPLTQITTENVSKLAPAWVATGGCYYDRVSGDSVVAFALPPEGQQ